MRIHTVAACFLIASLAGCVGGDGEAGITGAAGDDEADRPVLYLNVTVGDQTFRFSSADLAGNGTGAGAGASSNGTTSAGANATTGNTTANGNATAGNGTTTGAGNVTAEGNSTGPDRSDGPSGTAPLNVSVTAGASNLPDNGSLSWTLDFGDAGKAAAPAGNSTGNATGNATGGRPDGTNATASGPAEGTSLPATMDHTYHAEGVHDLVLTLTSGNLTLGTLRASVEVTAPGNGTTASDALPEPIVIEGSAFGVYGMPGDSEETFELDATVRTMTITLEFDDGGGNDLDWSIAGPGGEEGGGENSGAEDPVTFEAPTPGTWTVTLVPFLTVGPADYTITVTFA